MAITALFWNSGQTRKLMRRLDGIDASKESRARGEMSGLLGCSNQSARTINTEQYAPRATDSATLPSINLWRPFRPWDLRTIKFEDDIFTLSHLSLYAEWNPGTC